MTFFCSFNQSNQFQGNGEMLKITLLQCYEVLWIHNIDAICRTGNCQFRSSAFHLLIPVTFLIILAYIH